MWFEKFDGDLYNLIPEAREIVSPLSKITLFTHGSVDKDGHLNHPSVWNGDPGIWLAYFGTESPSKPESFVTFDPIVSCTAEDAVRDSFAHDYIIFINGVLIKVQTNKNLYFDLLSEKRGITSATKMDENKKGCYILNTLANMRVVVKMINAIIDSPGMNGVDLYLKVLGENSHGHR